MKERLKEAIKDAYYYNENDLENDEDLLEILREESEEIKSKFSHDSRWWRNENIICKIGERYFSYEWAFANRDEHIRDLGWEFDWDTLQEVEPYEEIIKVIKYRNI